MSEIRVDAAIMKPLFENAKKCMAVISHMVGEEEEQSGNGVVVHCDDEFTVVAVNRSYTFEGLRNVRMYQVPKAVAKFFDGTKVSDTAFIKLDRSINLIVARVARGGWQEAQYSQLSEEKHENVLSLVTIGSYIAPMVGQVISQRAIAVDRKGNVIPSSIDTFTFSLAMGGHLSPLASQDPKYKEKLQHIKNKVLGSPVFNFSGALVGLVERFGYNFDFKFGTRSEELEAAVDRWLAGREWRAAMEPHTNRVQRVGGSKRAKPTSHLPRSMLYILGYTSTGINCRDGWTERVGSKCVVMYWCVMFPAICCIRASKLTSTWS